MFKIEFFMRKDFLALAGLLFLRSMGHCSSSKIIGFEMIQTLNRPNFVLLSKHEKGASSL
jgi:hypothetical protein